MMHSQYGVPKKRGNANTHLPICEIACSCWWVIEVMINFIIQGAVLMCVMPWQAQNVICCPDTKTIASKAGKALHKVGVFSAESFCWNASSTFQHVRTKPNKSGYAAHHENLSCSCKSIPFFRWKLILLQVLKFSWWANVIQRLRKCKTNAQVIKIN